MALSFILPKLLCLLVLQVDSLETMERTLNSPKLRQRFPRFTSTSVLAPNEPSRKTLLISYEVEIPRESESHHGSVSFAFTNDSDDK